MKIEGPEGSLFQGKKFEGLKEISTSFAGLCINQHNTVEYEIDFKLNGKAMASIFQKKINVKLTFLHRQSRYLTPAFRRLPRNALTSSLFENRNGFVQDIFKELLSQHSA